MLIDSSSFKLSYNRNYFRIAVLLFLLASTYLLSRQLFLFYSYTSDSYPSDMGAHASFINLRTGDQNSVGYSLMHKLIAAIIQLCALSKEASLYASTVLLIIVIVLSQLFTVLVINKYFKEKSKLDNLYVVDVLTLLMMLVSMLVVNPFAKTLMVGVGTPNPWHNPTYLFSRPFSLLVFIYCLKFVEDSKNYKWNLKTIAIIIISAIFSVWAKPSFMLSFLPSIFIFSIILFIRKQISFVFLTVLGFALIPCFLPLLSINQEIYQHASSSNQIKISPGEAWGVYSSNIPLSILLALAFPIYVLKQNLLKMPNSLMLGFINLIISTLVNYMLIESGSRSRHNNFGWTYLFGMFFIFLTSIETFVLSRNSIKGIDITGSILFCLHILSGLYYFTIVLLGYNYY